MSPCRGTSTAGGSRLHQPSQPALMAATKFIVHVYNYRVETLYYLRVERATTVSDIASRLHVNELIFGGQALEDGRTLAYYNIGPDKCMIVHRRPCDPPRFEKLPRARQPEDDAFTEAFWSSKPYAEICIDVPPKVFMQKPKPGPAPKLITKDAIVPFEMWGKRKLPEQAWQDYDY